MNPKANTYNHQEMAQFAEQNINPARNDRMQMEDVNIM